MSIRKLPSQDERVETGPLQFGDDWSGFFIRGDDAFALRLAIANVIVNPNDWVAKAQLRGWVQSLDGCNQNKELVKLMNNQIDKENTNEEAGKDGALDSSSNRS